MADDTEWSTLILQLLCSVAANADEAIEESLDDVDANWQDCDNHIKRIDTLVKAEKVPARKSRVCVGKDGSELLEDS